MNQNTSLVQENYKDYTPPINVMKTVQILLEYVPAEDLASLQSIVLTNTEALSRERKRRRRTSRAPISHVRGLYHQAWNGQPAEIEIFVDNTLREVHSFFQKLSFCRNFIFAEVLFHEIGHHTQYISRSKLSEKEAFADNYEARLTKLFIRQRYGYLRIFRIPIRAFLWLIKKMGVVKS